MKAVSCKRCSTDNLFWTQNLNGKWNLIDKVGNVHRCNDGEFKSAKCKFCNAEDLHWAEETRPGGPAKYVLTESYGLPHACDERLAHMATEKQRKKDEYTLEKKRITDTPDGNCSECSGRGYSGNQAGSCLKCLGMGLFSEKTKKNMLYKVRLRIWPGIGLAGYGNRYRD